MLCKCDVLIHLCHQRVPFRVSYFAYDLPADGEGHHGGAQQLEGHQDFCMPAALTLHSLAIWNAEKLN